MKRSTARQYCGERTTTQLLLQRHETAPVGESLQAIVGAVSRQAKVSDPRSQLG
ncbi:MAG: hypothetical protein ACLPUG_08875 [Acidimicrobiales bacterium]